MEVRYGDIDAQGHLNNASYLTFFEQARIHYLVHLGLYDVQRSFSEIGVIIADIHIAYRQPVLWGTPIRVGVKTTRLGTKSFITAQALFNANNNQVLADGEVVLVTYDYQINQSIPLPVTWREKITDFEGLT